MKLCSSVYLGATETEVQDCRTKTEVQDCRKKSYTLEHLEQQDDSVLSLTLQPDMQPEENLETNMFSAYPQDNIPYSFSNSWIGM